MRFANIGTSKSTRLRLNKKKLLFNSNVELKLTVKLNIKLREFPLVYLKHPHSVASMSASVMLMLNSIDVAQQ